MQVEAGCGQEEMRPARRAASPAASCSALPPAPRHLSTPARPSRTRRSAGGPLVVLEVEFALDTAAASGAQRVEALDADAGGGGAASTRAAVAASAVEPEGERALLAASIEDATRQLAPGARQVFLLHDVEGYTHEEIASSLGITAGGSKSQLFKARAKLRRLLSHLVDGAAGPPAGAVTPGSAGSDARAALTTSGAHRAASRRRGDAADTGRRARRCLSCLRVRCGPSGAAASRRRAAARHG